MEWLWQVVDRSIAAVCALACIQIPSFFVQYMQRLSGHIQELKHQLHALTELARGSGLTLPQYIHKFTSQTDPDFSQHGMWMEALNQRYATLFHSWQTLQEATSWNRPFAFAANLDSNIAWGAWKEFQPAIAISTEGLLYAFAGVLIGSCAVFLLRSTGRLLARAFRIGVYKAS